MLEDQTIFSLVPVSLGCLQQRPPARWHEQESGFFPATRETASVQPELCLEQPSARATWGYFQVAGEKVGRETPSWSAAMPCP